MVPASHLLAFVLASVVLTAVPGPRVLFVVGRSLALGRRAGLLSVVGNTLGLLPLVVAERPRSSWRMVREGFVVGVSNPKAVLFLAAVLPQFAGPSAGSVAARDGSPACGPAAA